MNGRRKLFLTLILGIILQPAYAYTSPAGVRQQILSGLSAKLNRQDVGPTERQTQIQNALSHEIFRVPLRKDWSYFLAQNQLVQQQEQTDMENAVQLLYHQYDTDCNLFRKNIGKHLWGKFRPDYAKETKGVKYIYVSDASDHDTKTIPAEIGGLIKKIRQANPTARILLALEAARQVHPWQLPLRFAHSGANPFRVVNENYLSLIDVCDQKDVDVLGLDDSVFSESEEVKIGDIIIRTPFDNPQVQHILTEYDPQFPQHIQDYRQLKETVSLYEKLVDAVANKSPKTQELAAQLGIAQEELLDYLFNYEMLRPEYEQALSEYRLYLQSILQDFLARSDWGVLQRNRQWARYIKALSPFYDIVITYAGNGHFGDKGDTHNVPDLIGEQYIVFNFYTTEELPQEKQEFYEQVDQIQEEEHTFTSPLDGVTVREDVENEVIQLLDFWDYAGYRQPSQGEESEKYFFEQVKYTSVSATERQEMLEQCKQFSLPPSYMLMSFDVYLLGHEKP